MTVSRDQRQLQRGRLVLAQAQRLGDAAQAVEEFRLEDLLQVHVDDRRGEVVPAGSPLARKRPCGSGCAVCLR